MRFAELKQALDSFTPEQLAQTVRWWGDETGGTVNAVIVLEEDFANYGEGMEPCSTYAEPREATAAFLPKGTPILLCEDPSGSFPAQGVLSLHGKETRDQEAQDVQPEAEPVRAAPPA